MAVAEARAAWQRTANRCFVQEDAKRAPKLACCPSSSSSSKQVDAGPASAADGQDNPTVGFLPPSQNPSYSNLPPDSRWWLRLPPNYGYHRGLTHEQSNTLETEMEAFRASPVSSTSELNKLHPQHEHGVACSDDSNSVPSLDTHCGIPATCMKKDPGIGKQDLKAVYSMNAEDSLKLKDMGESYESYEIMEMDDIYCSVSKQPNEFFIDSETPWIGSEKSEPWWRTADRDELASLVAQRSLNLIENCDLPRPQNTHVKRDPYAQFRCFDHDGIPASSIDWKGQIGDCLNPTVHTRGNLTSGSGYGKQCASFERQSQSGLEKSLSDSTTHKASTEPKTSESDHSKAELLEALCHSQTRAREAEKAAKQAYEEKEHVVKLFFRQASHLFAYKQWFQLLQLENLYFQIKNNKNQPISTLFPVVLPWMPHKSRKLRISWQKATKGRRAKRGHPRYDISKYAVVFALGLGLVGAGLLLGWTVGWMLPTL